MDKAGTGVLAGMWRIGGKALPWALAVLVLVLAVTLFVVGEADERPRAEVGAVFENPQAEEALGKTGSVLIPWARLDVGVGPPKDELPDLGEAQPNLQAPEDGSFVRVQARIDEQIPIVVSRSPLATEVTIVLHADGRDYPVSSPGNLDFDPNGYDNRGGDRWVAVEGHPEDLEVRITVNGETQTVGADGTVDAGRAAHLERLPSQDEVRELEKVDCGRFRTSGDNDLSVSYPRTVKCSMTLSLRTPYVDGLGWAEPGREFLVTQFEPPARISVGTDNGGDDMAFAEQAKDVYSATLGGEPSVHGPVRVEQLSSGPFGYVGNGIQFVFDVPEGKPAGALRLTLDKRLRLGGPFVNEKRRLQVHWTIPGRKLA